VTFDEFKISTLSLKPNDTLVVKVKFCIGSDTATRLQAWVRAETGHQRVLILDDKLDLSVMKPQQTEAVA